MHDERRGMPAGCARDARSAIFERDAAILVERSRDERDASDARFLDIREARATLDK
jgi:hypothetical protein